MRMSCPLQDHICHSDSVSTNFDWLNKEDGIKQVNITVPYVVIAFAPLYHKNELFC
jgi:hypothetical protein